MCHGSHGSHSSHSQHANSDSHSNSVSSQSISTSNANGHTASIGGIDWSGSFLYNSTKLGVYGSSGSLTQLTNIVNSMRSRPTNTDYADNTDKNHASNQGSLPSKNTTITADAVNNLVKYGGSYYDTRYQPYTLSINTSASVTSNGGSVSGKTNNTATGVNKTQDIHGNLNTSTKSWTNSATGLAGTNKSFSFTDNLAGNAIVGSHSYYGSFSATKGTKITKTQASQILRQLQNTTLKSWKGPSSKSFSWGGSNNISHSNTHSNHSSHENS